MNWHLQVSNRPYVMHAEYIILIYARVCVCVCECECECVCVCVCVCVRERERERVNYTRMLTRLM
jgi:hypothetical protein